MCIAVPHVMSCLKENQLGNQCTDTVLDLHRQFTCFVKQKGRLVVSF